MAEDAVRRREARRRRILENSEDRMKRLLSRQEEPESQNAQGSESGSSNSSVVQKLEDAIHDDAAEAESTSREHQMDEAQAGVEDVQQACAAEGDGEPDMNPASTEDAAPPDASGTESANGQQQQESFEERQSSQDRSRSSSPAETAGGSTSLEQIRRQQGFTRLRQLLCGAVGVLVRLLFSYWLGHALVMNAMVPFVAFEIAVVAYQHSSGLDLGADVQGGLWLSTMVLSGVKPEVIETYKKVMGAFTAAGDDFTVYFFTFLVTHMVAPSPVT